jgi:hypothetical protein
MASQLDRIEKRLEQLAAEVRALGKGGTQPTPAPVAEQGAPPKEVLDFINQIMQPSAGADPTKVAESRANLARWAEEFNAQRHEGSSGVKALDLSPDDIVFMGHLASNAAHRFAQKGKGSPDIYHHLLVGSNAEINEAKNAYMDRRDVQGVRVAYMHDQAGWVKSYGDPRGLAKAFGDFMSAQGV